MNREKGYPRYSWELDYGNKEKRYSHIAGNLIVKIKKKILTYSWELVYENKEKKILKYRWEFYFVNKDKSTHM